MSAFQSIQIWGKFIFAAQGLGIYTFSLRDGAHVATWTASSLGSSQHVNPLKLSITQELVPASGKTAEAAADQPRCKKRRLTAIPASPTNSHHGDQQISCGEIGNADVDGATSGLEKHPVPHQDVPLIGLMTTTMDGTRLVAVGFQDKAIHVFEHDGEGKLTHLSKRIMPKRPCSLTLTPDGASIISADKFGDVYLMPVELSRQQATSSPNSLASGLTATAVANSKLTAATPLTVHTSRNLQALENQLLQAKHPTQSMVKDPAILNFPHTLLLGHVSMLTCVAVALDSGVVGLTDGKARLYILTADRDEHIRVSRGPPQSHIIEHFCLGHRQHVTCLCVLEPRRPDLLVSGGGDECVFLWDWKQGTLLATASVLDSVRKELPSLERITIKHICRFIGSNEAVMIAVTCERVPAIVVFELLTAPDRLVFNKLMALPGNPLDLRALPAEPGQLIVSMDMLDDVSFVNPRIGIVSIDADTTMLQALITRHESVFSDTMSTFKLRNILYGAEQLRKGEQ